MSTKPGQVQAKPYNTGFANLVTRGNRANAVQNWMKAFLGRTERALQSSEERYMRVGGVSKVLTLAMLAVGSVGRPPAARSQTPSNEQALTDSAVRLLDAVGRERVVTDSGSSTSCGAAMRFRHVRRDPPSGPGHDPRLPSATLLILADTAILVYDAQTLSHAFNEQENANGRVLTGTPLSRFLCVLEVARIPWLSRYIRSSSEANLYAPSVENSAQLLRTVGPPHISQSTQGQLITIFGLTRFGLTRYEFALDAGRIIQTREQLVARWLY